MEGAQLFREGGSTGLNATPAGEEAGTAEGGGDDADFYAGDGGEKLAVEHEFAGGEGGDRRGAEAGDAGGHPEVGATHGREVVGHLGEIAGGEFQAVGEAVGAGGAGQSHEAADVAGVVDEDAGEGASALGFAVEGEGEGFEVGSGDGGGGGRKGSGG